MGVFGVLVVNVDTLSILVFLTYRTFQVVTVVDTSGLGVEGLAVSNTDVAASVAEPRGLAVGEDACGFS